MESLDLNTVLVVLDAATQLANSLGDYKYAAVASAVLAAVAYGVRAYRQSKKPTSVKSE